jgi:hypothetical protein
MNNSDKLKSTLSAVFIRKGQGGRYTRLFENLEPHQKQLLLREIQLFEEELPVIGSMESQDKWLLITTKRIIWHTGGKTKTLAIETVQDAVADFQKLLVTGIKKEQMREVRILTVDGGQHIIEIEEGAPLMGVWNVLKNLGARNRPEK